MSRTKEEMKQAVCAAVDRHRERLLRMAEEIAAEPELGYKEVKTAAKFKELLQEADLPYRDEIALTGVVSEQKGRESRLRVAVMGELDAILVPQHPQADPLTGAAHACGHNTQMASVAGVALALKESGVMDELDGDVVIMGVPAEEFVELEYRDKLRQAGKIHFLGGKQEFIRLGEFDDIDISIMQHTSLAVDGKAGADADGNGFVGKLIRYIGKEAHAGAAPHEGVNALNAAMIALMAVHAQRETFRDEDHIRVHPIITKGGDIVNVVPADVRLETYIRGASVEAILDAEKKVDRAFQSGGDAVGARTVITDLPGYLPPVHNEALMQIMLANMETLFGAENCKMYCPGFGGGSSDQGDVSNLLPSIQSYFGGAEGGFHTESFCIVDPETAVIQAAKAMAMTVVDLLADGAAKGREIKAAFRPKMTKEEYLRNWGKITD